MRKTILAIGAHADDCEIGAGGVLIQAARRGCRVVVVTVAGDYSTWAPTAGREAATIQKLTDLAKQYGMEKIFLPFPYHVVDGGDVELKRKLARIYLDVKPDVALIHHTEDRFSDHVACGRAAHDACMFPHGLSGDLNAERIERILAYTVTPWQTYRFEEDCYYDVGDVMPEYMDLLNQIDAIYFGRNFEDNIRGEVTLKDSGRKLRLGGHAWTKFADCVQHGSRARCPFAIGFKTVWDSRRGRELY